MILSKVHHSAIQYLCLFAIKLLLEVFKTLKKKN